MKFLTALVGLALLAPSSFAAPRPGTSRNHGLVARDLIGGTQTDNPEPCATKCKNGEILTCNAVDYDKNHTWRCFCHDGAMCMGSQRGRRGKNDNWKPDENISTMLRGFEDKE